ncbi:MAG TPA: type IV secretion system DNA-binding domain-containing protein [Blastocatellia bacterium]|nr:type IV secretion system DNA-binding domain-containing protein [Blastocatellia bacterium]
MDALAFLFFISLLICIVIGVRLHHRHEQKLAWEREQAERRRVEACGEVVLFFANYLGYIARSVISREELDELIESGIAAVDLAREINDRIEAVEGTILGTHPFNGGEIKVKLPDSLRDRHLYVVGKSGSGKTNLLRNLIFQDLAAGHGLAVLAPEPELLTEELLPYIPDERLDDVIYLDPDDATCPGLNPFILDEGEELDLKVDETLTIFKRLMPELGPRTEQILRQALYALVGRKGATLLDVERLLDRTDSSFREQVIKTCHDQELIHFWRDVYEKFPADAHLPIVNRLGRFLRPRVMRNVLCRSESLNFGEAMDEGRILLFNLSDGLLGEQNSQLLGQLIVSKFQLATMARAKQPKHRRRRFHLYLDEFQTFTGTAAASYEKILSRARKYALSITLAHQTSAQLPPVLMKEILGNVATSIFFQVSRDDASKFARELVTTYNGEVVTVPDTELLQLRVGQAWCKIGQSAFPLQTYLANQSPDLRRTRLVIERSRDNYGMLALPAPALNETDDADLEDEEITAEPADDWLDDLDPARVFE